MEDEKIIALMEGYGAGSLSEEETIVFFQWYSEASLSAFNRLFAQCKLLPGSLPAYPAMPHNFRMQLEQAIRDQEATEQQHSDTQGRLVPLFRRRWGWAAAILLLISVGGYVFYNSRQGDPARIVNNYPSSSNDVAPGTTKAVLTLADGRQVTIDSAQTGQLAMQGKTIVQHNQGAISYNGNGSEKTQQSVQPLLYNTLTTSRGEQSPPLILSDGTKVWLNALSSIRFPVAFTGNARNVEITGEAFFEVAKDASKPFHVTVKDMEVEVLGTQFNVNAYPDEDAIRTTLLEGKVKVVNRQSSIVNAAAQKSANLTPGQQAQLSNNRLSIINNPNIDQVIAWKNGLFDFNRVNLQTVLQQLSRWYDIEVKLEGNIPARTFRGKITRDLSLSQVIQVLQDVEVKLRIEGKTLFVTSH